MRRSRVRRALKVSGVLFSWAYASFFFAIFFRAAFNPPHYNLMIWVDQYHERVVEIIAFAPLSLGLTVWMVWRMRSLLRERKQRRGR